MKTALAALAVLASLGWLNPAQAQGVPPGSYLQSCSNIDLRGNTLTATCRQAGGRQQRTALSGVDRCDGDIGNNDGVLQCAVRGGGQARGEVVQGPGRAPTPDYGRDGRRDDTRGRDDARGRDDTRGRDARRDDPRESRRQHCRELDQRAADLRAERDWARYPDDRARVERHLRRVQDEQREARCRP